MNSPHSGGNGVKMSTYVRQAFTRIELTAILAIAIVGGIMVNLQPLLLGNLLAEGRLTTAQLGQAAMLELLGTAISIGAAGAWMPLTSLRPQFVLIGMAATIANLLTMISSGGWVLAARGVAGLLEGVMLWLSLALFTRVAVPARTNGIYLFALAITSFCLASLLSLWLIPVFGTIGGFACIALVSLAATILALRLPKAFFPLSDSNTTAVNMPSRHGNLPSIRGCVSLIALFGYIAAVLSVWAYISPLGTQSGLSPSIVDAAVSLAIAAEIAGALTASLVSRRLHHRLLLVGGMIGAILLCGLMWRGLTSIGFIAWTMTFGFLWYLMMPFQMPFVIAADPSRRAAMLSGMAQMFGCAAGPLLASLVVSQTDARPVLLIGSSLFALSTILVIFVDGRPAPVEGQ